MGAARFTIWGAYRVLCLRTYLGSIYYSGQSVKSMKEVEELDDHSFTDLPEMNEDAVRHE